ncbi:hypothetical protein S83_070345, partial [Arachis hypogaea]
MRRCDRNHLPLRLNILLSQNLSIPLVTTQLVWVKTAHSLFSVTKNSEERQVGLGDDEPRWRTDMVVTMNRDISTEQRSMENADNFAKLKGLMQGHGLLVLNKEGNLASLDTDEGGWVFDSSSFEVQYPGVQHIIMTDIHNLQAFALELSLLQIGRINQVSRSQCFPIQITGWPLELMAYAYLAVSPPSMIARSEK